jgi:hypothetical protein
MESVAEMGVESMVEIGMESRQVRMGLESMESMLESMVIIPVITATTSPTTTLYAASHSVLALEHINGRFQFGLNGRFSRPSTLPTTTPIGALEVATATVERSETARAQRVDSTRPKGENREDLLVVYDRRECAKR